MSPRAADPTRVRLLASLLALAALAGCGSEPERTASAPPRVAAAEHKETDAMAPLPKARPKLVQPEAGEASTTGLPAGAGVATNDDTSLPKPTGAASDTTSGAISDPNAKGLSATKATALSNGVALPPLEAPEAVLDVIRAGNIIARTPYKWGGGHGRFQDSGYDCSGSVSYALYYAGLIDGPHTSGELMAYGKPGPGKWITLYANAGHVYMEVAGIRFDTSAADPSNRFSRWQNQLRTNTGFEARHPPGL
jgi:cell wall-associated NlpC family hydrolase